LSAEDNEAGTGARLAIVNRTSDAYIADQRWSGGLSENYIRPPGPGVVNCLTGLCSPSVTPSLPIEVTV
jgi:hypothetical protein